MSVIKILITLQSFIVDTSYATDSICMCEHVCIPVSLCVEPLVHQCIGALEESGWSEHVSIGRSKGYRCSSQKYRNSYAEDPWHSSELGGERGVL